jgi:hypothetical protein
MSDRLQELLRQRALLQEHLGWLDREIASATSDGVPPLPTKPNPQPQAVAPQMPAVVSTPSEAEKILGSFSQDPQAVQTDTRRGCMIIFAIAMALLGLAAIVSYSFYARHLGRWW